MAVTATSSKMIRVWLVEDNDLLRESIHTVIDSTPGMACPVAAASVEEALVALDSELDPDVVLMDVGLPGMSGVEGVRRLRSRAPACLVMMLTIHDESETVFQAICAGASGYLLKPSTADQIVEAIRDIDRGASPLNGYIARRMLDLFPRLKPAQSPECDYGLTRREQEVLQLLVDGLTMRQIAERLGVSYHTIDTHIRHLYRKLHVGSRSGAVAKALQESLL